MEIAKEVHEGSITTQIVETVLNEANQRKARRVVKVNLTIGSLTFLNPEQVQFWYKILTKETIMEGSILEIEGKDGTVRCPKCEYEGDFKYVDDSIFHAPIPVLQCPQCDGKVEIISGKDCLIRSVKMLL
ncbi:MAG: hydrogenase maturation nickel metallochaperone HypA [Candidatus Bathyarchaeota archaeon]|nr:MAG: hydrogenase maturation nickel metallochaperone HypA [Candidatus Bathyarchaeota archaeon]